MLPRPRALFLLSAGLSALTGCESGGIGAGEVLVVAEVEISPPAVSLVVGTTQQLQATPKTSSGITVPNRQVAWSSEDPGVATVSSSGLVTAVTDGVTRINATVDGVRRSVAATITPKPVVSVTIVPDQVTLLVTESGDLTATGRDAAGQPLPGRAVTFASDNPLIATVSTMGHVTAIGPGLTVVRATIEGKTGTANVSVNARPATQLDFQTEPGTGAAGVPLAAIRIAVQNDQGGTVTAGVVPVSIALAGNPTGAVLSGTRTVNAVNGVAIFTDLSVNAAGTGYTLRVSSGTLSPAESAPFAIVAGAASALSISTQPSPAGASGTPLPRQPVLQVRDANGNAVASAGIQVTAALQGAGASLGGTRTVTTNADGIATFSNLVLSGSAGTYTLLFAAPGLTAVASSSITVSAGAAAILRLAQQPAATVKAGVVFGQQPVLRLEDADGNPVTQAGLPVTAAFQTGGGLLIGTTTVLTDGTGLATFANLAIGGTTGIRTLRFSATGVTPAISENVDVGPGLASALTLTTGPPPASASGAILSPGPVVQVIDGYGNAVDPAPEIAVTATIASGAGGSSLSGTTTAVTASGTAPFSGLILTGPSGAYTLRFSGGGLTPAVSTAIVIGAGVPAALFVVTQPSSAAQSGVAFTQQPVVQVRDPSGNPVSVGGIVVTVTMGSGDGTVGGTIARATSLNGQAAFTDLAITGTPGPHTLRFSAGGLTGATSTAITLGASPPASLTILTGPSTTAVSGVVLFQQPVVKLTDAAGAPVNGATITAVINTGPAGSSLAGAAALTDASGVAAFTALALTGGPGDYTLRFESNGLQVVSGAVTIAAIPVGTTLLLATPPEATASSGTPFATQPVVQIADAGGAAVAQAGTTVTAVVATGPGGATLAGTTAVSDAAGRAAFSGLAISGPAGNYTLRFEANPLTPVTTGAIALGAGSPATVTIITGPPTAIDNDEVFGNTVVRVQDGLGNNLSGIAVTAAVATGSGGLKGTLSRTTGPDGRATFNDLRLVGLAGAYTLVFTTPGGASISSGAITLAPGAEAVLAIQVQPSANARSGEDLAVQPKVELRDTGGNLVTRNGVRINVSLETISGLGSLRGSGRENTNDGVSSWDNLRINGAGTFRLQFTSNGLTGVTSASIVVTLF